MVYKKGEKDATPEDRPLQRAIDILEAALKVSFYLYMKMYRFIFFFS
jgi:hypothetical protein